MQTESTSKFIICEDLIENVERPFVRLVGDDSRLLKQVGDDVGRVDLACVERELDVEELSKP